MMQPYRKNYRWNSVKEMAEKKESTFWLTGILFMVTKCVAQLYGLGMCSLLRLCLNPNKLLTVNRFFPVKICSHSSKKK